MPDCCVVARRHHQWSAKNGSLHSEKRASTSLTKRRALSNSCRTAPRHRLQPSAASPRKRRCPFSSPTPTKTRSIGQVSEGVGIKGLFRRASSRSVSWLHRRRRLLLRSCRLRTRWLCLQTRKLRWSEQGGRLLPCSPPRYRREPLRNLWSRSDRRASTGRRRKFNRTLLLALCRRPHGTRRRATKSRPLLEPLIRVNRKSFRPLPRPLLLLPLLLLRLLLPPPLLTSTPLRRQDGSIPTN